MVNDEYLELLIIIYNYSPKTCPMPVVSMTHYIMIMRTL